MTKNNLKLICMGLCFGIICMNAIAKDFLVVKNNKVSSVIVHSNTAKGCIPATVKMLQDGVFKMSGCKLPVEKVSSGNLGTLQEKLKNKNVILVGRSAWTEQLKIVTPKACDAYKIESFLGIIALVGNDDQIFSVEKYRKIPTSGGTFYAGVNLLEMMGMRFYGPKVGNITPEKKTIAVSLPLHVSRKPYFKYRMAEGFNRMWRRQAGYGGNCDPWTTRHTFAKRTKLYDWQKMFTKTHPEYFCMNKQNCLSNNLYMIAFPHKGVVEEIIEQAKDYFSSKRLPGRRDYFLVIQNDYFKEVCACETCQKLIDYSRPANGQYSDYVVDAVVKVAKAVKKDFPNQKIVHCAYERYTLPPAKIKQVPDNVVILLAQNRQRSGYKSGRKEMNQLVRAWQNLKPQSIALLRYYMNGRSVMPRFFPRGIAANIKDMKDLSESGPTPIIGEMHFTRGNFWWLEFLEYVTARCLWNPDLDIEKLLSDFCKDSFGPAAKPMLQYLNLLEKYHLEEPKRGVYSPQQLEKLESKLKLATKLASKDPWRGQVALLVNHFNKIKKVGVMPDAVVKSMINTKAKKAVPIVKFDFDVSLSDIINDSSGSEAHAILVGGKRIKSSVGKAIQFDGKNDYIKLRKPILLDKNYTLEAWVKPGLMNKKNIIHGELTDNYRPYHIFGSAANCHAKDRISISINGGKFRFHDRGVATINASSKVLPDKWVHIVGTYTPRQGMILYINGKIAAFSGPKKRMKKRKTPLLQLIGASGGISSRYGDEIADCRGFFKGYIDEVKVYDTCLPGSQVKEKFQKGNIKFSRK